MNSKKRIVFALGLLFVLYGYSFQHPVLENGKLRVNVTEKGGISFTDKTNNTVWGNDFPGWVEIEQDGKKKKIPLTGSKVEIGKTDSGLQVVFNTLNGMGVYEPEFLMEVGLSCPLKGI